MRIGIISTLSVLLPLIYSPRPATAQFNPAGPQSVRQDELKPAGRGWVKRVASTPAEQALNSTLAALKEGNTSQGDLSQQLAHVMMRFAEDADRPPWPVVVSLTDKLTRELVGKQPNSDQKTAMRECIIEVMRREGTSNADLGSRIQDMIVGCRNDGWKVEIVCDGFYAGQEA